VARTAPIGPEIYEYGNRRVLNDLIELHIVDRERFRDGRQWRFASSATAGAGEVLRGDAIFLSAMSARANDRHTKPPSYRTGAEDKMQAIGKKSFECRNGLQQQVKNLKRALPVFGCRMLGLRVDDFECARDGES